MSLWSEADCDIKDFEALCNQRLDAAEVPQALNIEKNVPIYAALSGREDTATRNALLSEWGWVLGEGPGIFAIQQAVTNHDALDAATAAYMSIIEEERADSTGGDHFAAAGANDRVWNSLQKLCIAEPAIYARIFGAPSIAAASEAWLGPHFQMTAQVNLVRPGGAAQNPHRDYHLGFMTQEGAATYPKHAHALTAALTLQGAIAHCDMPVEAGPTQLLPYSQLYGPGYLAYHRPEFADYFAAHHIQVPLAKGDALFFNPALFHAGGHNKSADIQRFANLVQVSSAFGRAMESLDRAAMCNALYPHLADLPPEMVQAAIACTAEGYAFPTSLDNDPPIGGLSPKTQADLMREAVASGASPQQFAEMLAALDDRRQP